MDYERLTPEYWRRQVERLSKACRRLGAPAAVPGRLVPDEEDLVIGTGRRLPMAVMFLDICGFSKRPAESKAEQESLLRALNFFFTEMIRIAEDYGGTVEKNTGDGLMVYFADGEGTPGENGSKRAVAAGLTMLHTAESLVNPVIEALGQPRLEFRVGIDHGPVTIARLGAAGRFGSLVAVGTTANLACKLLAEGKAGEIILGENVHRQLSPEWRHWSSLQKVITGWIFINTGLPYSFYRFGGRWKAPV